MSRIEIKTEQDDHGRSFTVVTVDGQIVPWLERVLIDFGIGVSTVTLHVRETEVSEDGTRRVKVYPDRDGSHGLSNVLTESMPIETLDASMYTTTTPTEAVPE